eukprot:751602-Hanusia_phi.AAC.2
MGVLEEHRPKVPLPTQVGCAEDDRTEQGGPRIQPHLVFPLPHYFSVTNFLPSLLLLPLLFLSFPSLSLSWPRSHSPFSLIVAAQADGRQG